MKSLLDSMSRVELISSDSTSGDGAWTPVTGPMSAGGWDAVRVAWLQIAGTSTEARPGVQYSNDGVSWDAPEELTASWAAPTSAMEVLAETALPPMGVTERLLVRFGYFSRRTSGSVSLKYPILFQFSPAGVRARRVGLEIKTVATKQSTTAIFVPATEGLALGKLSEVRGTLEVMAVTGACETALAYQLSTDGSTWGSGTILPGSSYRNSTGLDYGAFTSLAPGAYAQIRFGYLVKDAASPTQVNYARVAGWVEIR